MGETKNIIIRMPNWVGDAVMASPLIIDIKNKFPESPITLMCQGAIGQLFAHEPLVSDIIHFKKPSGFIHHLHQSELIRDLRKGEYDTGILTTNSLSSAWWFWRGHIKNRIGFSGRGRDFLLTEAIAFPANRNTQHLVKTYKELLKPLGISESSTLPRLVVTEEELKDAKGVLDKEGCSGKSLIGINPGAAYGSAKCWLPERFRSLTQKLIEDPNVIVVYFGDHTQRPMIEDITKDLGSKVLNLAGKTNLRDLMAFISLLDVMVANDSGPMHMAYGLNVPVVALFGPTSDKISGPLGVSETIHKHVECSPCFKRECPIDHRCMTRITSDEVYDAIQRLRRG